MNPSISPDINYLALSGEQQFTGPTDLSGVDGSKYATTLKLTGGIHGQMLNGLQVAQSKETSVDMDMARDMTVGGDFGLGPVGGDNILRAKGGFRRIAFAGQLHSRGQRNGIDIELGNWMDQTYALSWGCDLRGMLPHADGQGENTVAIGWVIPFTVQLGDNCRVLRWESLKIKLYVVAKFFIRLALRIPKGTKGPGWF